MNKRLIGSVASLDHQMVTSSIPRMSETCHLESSKLYPRAGRNTARNCLACLSPLGEPGIEDLWGSKNNFVICVSHKIYAYVLPIICIRMHTYYMHMYMFGWSSWLGKRKVHPRGVRQVRAYIY